MPPLSLLIKPVSSKCNMNCRYCFYRDEANLRSTAFCGMTDSETMGIAIKKAVEFADGYCSFMFQGGEPCLAGLDFYRDVVNFQKKYAKNGLKIYNSIQTNGTLITDKWAEFFAKNDFLVGLSLDGVQELHDFNRKFENGNGSFSKVTKAAAILKKHNVDFSILSVVTGQNAKKAEKNYNFFKRSGFEYLQFIPCLEPLKSDRGQTDFALSPEQYGKFLIRLFDLWSTDILSGKKISVRYFDNLTFMLKGYPPEACNMSGRCGLQFVIEGDGNVYPCDFFALDNYCMGNIKTDTFDRMINSQNATEFITESLNVPEDCKKCEWYYLCRNGCKRDRIKDGNGYQKNYYCEAFKMFFENRMNELKFIAGIK